MNSFVKQLQNLSFNVHFFTLFGPLVMYPTFCAADVRNLNLNLKNIAGEDTFTRTWTGGAF